MEVYRLSLLFPAFMHEPGFTTNQRFVSFDSPGHTLKRPSLHHKANPMEHKPSSLLRHTEVSPDFVATNSVFATDQQPHCREPLCERDWRIFKDRSDFNRELPMIVVNATLPDTAGTNEKDFFASAPWANNPVRPTQGNHELQAGIFIGEVADSFGQSLGRIILVFTGCHRESIAKISRCVKYIVTFALWYQKGLIREDLRHNEEVDLAYISRMWHEDYLSVRAEPHPLVCIANCEYCEVRDLFACAKDIWEAR